MIFQVWLEGHEATGSKTKAVLLGDYEAESFSEAIKEACLKNKMDSRYLSLDAEPSYWGCRFFDNENDARKTFG
ncbi:hypothetical protein KTJ53_12700 [Acinetobacter variabilis]|uniref:hypothetical protein n=1 Tax=Acinetobacter variabilis TaxID=70346 RepID=UPI0021D2FCA4|nr:hypothetical protein [Acinetobacter variabilis]MCU4630532.1 hypothetical protein [Acinetobacter variabilis]